MRKAALGWIVWLSNLGFVAAHPSDPETNIVIESTTLPGSVAYKYIGKQNTCSESGRLVWVPKETSLCSGRLFVPPAKVNDQVILVLEKDVADVKECRLRTLYENFAASTAVGIVSLSSDGLPGQSFFFHDGFGETFEPSALFSRLPILLVQRDVFEPFRKRMQSGQVLNATLACDGTNPWEAVFGMYLPLWSVCEGFAYLLVMMSAISLAINLRAKRLLSRASHLGEWVILVYVGWLNFLRGMAAIFGVKQVFSHSPAGDDIFGIPIKRFFGTQLVSWDFFLAVLLSLCWSSIQKSSETLLPTKHFLGSHRAKTIAVLTFLFCVAPDIALSILAATYHDTPNVTVTAALFLSGFIVSVSLQYKSRQVTLKVLHSSKLDPSAINLLRFARYVARWLNVFTFTIYLRLAFVLSTHPSRILTREPVAVMVFSPCYSATEMFASYAVIKAFRGNKGSQTQTLSWIAQEKSYSRI